jgi:hypothetical protein
MSETITHVNKTNGIHGEQPEILILDRSVTNTANAHDLSNASPSDMLQVLLDHEVKPFCICDGNSPKTDSILQNISLELVKDNKEVCQWGERMIVLSGHQMAGSINTGCDNSHGTLYWNAEHGTVAACDGRDETHLAMDVARSLDEVRDSFLRHVDTCANNQEYAHYAQGFVDMLVHDGSMINTQDDKEREAVARTDGMWRTNIHPRRPEVCSVNIVDLNYLPGMEDLLQENEEDEEADE